MPKEFYFNDNFKDNTIDLLYKGRPIPIVSSMERAVYISPSGENTIALIGRQDRPFKTIQGAIDSALLLYNGAGNGNLQFTFWLMPGVYKETVAIDTTLLNGTILLMPGVWWYQDNGLCLNMIQQSNISVVGLSRNQCRIERRGTSVGSAIYARNGISLKSLFIRNSGGIAVESLQNWAGGVFTFEDCDIRSTGGDAVLLSYGELLIVKHCKIESTIGHGINGWTCKGVFINSTVIGQIDGLRSNNGTSIKLINSFVDGKTGWGFNSGNWFENIDISSSIIRGFNGAFYCWDNGVYPDRYAIINNSFLLNTNPTGTVGFNTNTRLLWSGNMLSHNATGGYTEVVNPKVTNQVIQGLKIIDFNLPLQF